MGRFRRMGSATVLAPRRGRDYESAAQATVEREEGGGGGGGCLTEGCTKIPLKCLKSCDSVFILLLFFVA